MDEKSNDKVPQGVSAIFIADGRVIADATCFNRSRPGGYTVQEAQEHRARERLARAVIRELASPLLADNIDSYLAERILQAIPGKVHILQIGNPDSASREQEKT